jgi:aminoglycoside phosphotransferase (APT) family kinase protein
MDPDALAELLGATVTALTPLTGGASADTWSADVRDDSGTHALIVRRRGGLALGLDPAVEAQVQRVAQESGVPTPRVVATFADHPSLGSGYVMERLDGETLPRRLLGDPGYAAARTRLATDCARALSRIHAVPRDRLPADLPRQGAAAALALLEDLHRSIGQPVPTFELGFRWLHAQLPMEPELSLVHGDFRLGNLLVSAHGLVAVLDWELAHLGDPLEDLAWLCTRAWRFGGPGEAGGFAARPDLYAAYGPVDGTRLRFWEVFAALRWGVICQLQCAAHPPSVERATIGRRVTEAELDLLLTLEDASHA